MAQKQIVQLVDDIDGGVAHETVPFSLDGVQYEIDLSDRNATRLRDALTAFTERARRTGTVRRRGNAAKPVGSDPAGIRQWALDHGYDVSPAGRLPGRVLNAYQRATTRRGGAVTAAAAHDAARGDQA